MSWGETAHAPVLSVTAAACERQEGGKVWRETLLCWQHGEGEAGQHMAAPDGNH